MKAIRKTVRNIIIDDEVCKGCHLCIDQCSKDVFEVSQQRTAKGYLVPTPARTDECIGCLLCEMTCPDLAITVEGFENEK